MDYPETNPETDFDPKRFWMTITGICAVIVFGSVFVTRSYMNRRQFEADNYRPPHLTKLEDDLKVINRNGEEVALSELKGRTWVMGYMYTDCPSGCLGLAAYLEQLHGSFGKRDDFHLVSISLNPSEDTPEKIRAWIDNHSISIPGDDWWFLTGDETKIRDYVMKFFHMPYGDESEDPAIVASQGKFQHQPMLVLVDGIADIRGYYRVMQSDIGKQEFERLKRDIELVLEEAGGETSVEVAAEAGTTDAEATD